MKIIDAIPEDHQPAVRDALLATFESADYDLVEKLTGVSALGVFRISVEGADYVLRLDPRHDVLRDPVRQAACIRIASAGGVTPEHVFADEHTGVSIARYVTPHPAPWATRLVEAASLVRRLHALPLFPRLAPYRDNMQLVRVGLTETQVLPPPVLSSLVEALDRALDAYPWDNDLVSSHNDLNPSNMVFDGERTWIVDWETAFAADRYVDIAALANWLTSSEAGENQVLRGYFGEPTAYQRARFHLMRQINRLFYGGMLLITAAGPGVQVSQADWDANPGLDVLRPQMNKLAIHGGRLLFGCAFLKDALAAIAAPAFAEAVEEVRRA